MVSVLSSSTRNLTALGKITGFIKNSAIHPAPVTMFGRDFTAFTWGYARYSVLRRALQDP